MEVTAKKHKLPVYITAPTLQNSRLKLNTTLVNSFSSYKPVRLNKISVTAFPKLHDAADPYSFIVEHKGTTVGVFTDIGCNCENVIRNFKQCNAAFLEANYDEKMLEEGDYPFHLKKRIRSDKGHLSNDQSLELFTKHRPPTMSHLLLSHLSKHNNSPKLVYDLFKKHAGNTTIAVASRYEETEVYYVGNSSPQRKQQSQQMTLF